MSIPTSDDEGQWANMPKKTKVTDGWTCLVLDNGYKILTFGDQHMAGAEVYVIDPDNHEVAGWESSEWKTDPEEVMGAILRAAGGR